MIKETTIQSLLYVIVFAPLIGAIINGVFPRVLSRRAVSVIGVGLPTISFVATVLALVGFLGLRSADPTYTAVSASLFSWIVSGPISVDFALWLDPLSIVMTLVVTGIGSLIHLYSVGYMHDDPSYARYFSHLNLFLFSMLLLVLGRSLLLLFVGWEGVGLCSYLLIGFWFDDMDKAIAGKKAFIVNRIGDFGFLIAMFFLIFALGGSLDIPSLRAMVADPTSIFHSNTAMVTAVTLLLFLGATGKSAQIPLYIWLPDAMAGPTPVSALIHAATMVTAGVYMIARLNFLYVLSPVSMAVVATVGALTAIFAASIGLVQNDIKKVLAYSTVSQLGYMVLAVGVGAFGAGIFHLMTHAFFKACLFLGAGSVIHAMAGEQDIQKMGGLRKKMPITHITFLISTMAIAGVPLLSGFFSKDEILFSALALQHSSGTVAPWLNKLWFGLAIGAALMTAIYMFRLYFLTFSGELRSPDAHPHESPASMTIPLIVLAIGAALAGYLGLPIPGKNLLHNWLAPVFADGASAINSTGSHTLEYALMGVSTVVALAGIGLAWALYRGPWQHVPAKLQESLAGLYKTLVNKYYVDEAYNAVVVKPLIGGSKLLHRWVDAGLIDGIAVNGPAKALAYVGRTARRLATGDVQTYAAIFAIGIVLLVLFVM
ncbi:MAG TPA: NADH-quinone oxidoreductase subunit L [Myxococcota bacterium]|nr:NADH-quinone oxidoreductase subunit L [Myxococcota bacterium]HON25453.1 NADH-quinone oxidoreductase subunit L [Myxococcota bacterium]HOS62613.1 NADH-quinone oxidoreductase subunit L [Myxococcota bacterium]HPC92443.1 NADH-quinone oxidoreductase subunit L [Myxococcota bacterium]HPL25760.1 NADH-quinone oxidoreductase subunit L [Myxococcota bacterium]